MFESKIVFFGEFPPKVCHGISLSNERILNVLCPFFHVVKLEDRSSFGGFFSKLFSFFYSSIRLIFLSFFKIDIYYTNFPMSSLGLWKVYVSVLIVGFFSPRVKIISHLHRGDLLDFIKVDKNRKLFDRFVSRIDFILVLSESSESDINELLPFNNVVVRVVRNTIKLESEYNVRDVDFLNRRFYCLCNYISSKRIHSMVSIANYYPNFSVDFNGVFSSNDYMEKLKKLDVNNVCNFGGVVSGQDKETKLRCAKALVLPSLNEGMPLVILESLAQGTPVICFNIGYISEYLGENYPGLVKELTDEAFREKMDWLNQLPEDDYKNLRDLSYSVFWENYSPDKVNENILSVFQDCIDQSSI
ncbi:glycosyltransferase [Marinomonas arenicola]|uniref:glycosyltransferase family 4 protein n=1 Tax=Marinomonas arenicola TaxID=569601 RepID=UPI00311EFB67